MSSIIKVNTVQDTDGNNIINENANTITIGASGDTISIPSGATLANNGTATGFASIDWQSTIVTGATHTASANQGIWINTTSNACTLTLPGSPSVGDQLIFSDFARTWNSNAVTLSLNGSKFQGNTSPDPVYDTQGEAVHIVYSGSTQGWIPINDGGTALETPQTVTTSFLVVAGGGSGGAQKAGGGGAGGYRASFSSVASGGGGSAETALSLTPGVTYTITVGNGGAARSTPSAQTGANGGDSSISGTGITTITSAGGGGGGGDLSPAGPGAAGGCGGGAGGNGPNPIAGGAGTTNQGFAGGSGYSGSQAGGGGGGGAGAVGASVPGNAQPGGAGGAGVASTITGSSVTRAGGGGGVNENSGVADGAGGTGGGGAGGRTGGTAGTANTGGGGGGTHNSGTSGAGGSGVVILRLATADYSGTTSGSPTVDQSTVSGQTILIYNGDGSYTA